jgi:phenylacetaldehyde dehydrogenase
MMELVDRIEGRREVPERALAWLESPNDGARLAMSRVSDQAAIHRCLTVADGLHTRGEWKDLETERATYLERIASEVERRASAIADVDARSTGILLDLTTRFARIAALAFRGAAAQLRAGFLETRLENVQIRREPRGIAVVIAPWNAPAAIAAHKVASARPTSPPP